MDVRRGSFVTLDGLSASGKTTVAPLVAALLGGVHLTDDALPTFPRMRAEVDAAGILPARFHWWMMANHIKSEKARTITESGQAVVVESYFPRTVATHRAMGHPCAAEYPSGVLAPDVAIFLGVDEHVRQERLRRRAERGVLSYWHQREEPNVAESSRVYLAFGLVSVDGTDRTPEEVAGEIADIVRSRVPNFAWKGQLPMTTTEFEAKILGIEPEKMRARLAEAGAEHLGDRFQRRYVYDIPGRPGTWVRLRDTGSSVTLCVKEIHSDAIDGATETETTVGDFDTTNTLLGKLGYQPKAYQENRRSSWTLGGAAIEIDHWPLIPPYLEIEGDSADHVHAMVLALGLPLDELTSENTTKVYRQYGIDIEAIPRLTFE